jgi:hypothetical protein
LTRQLNNMAAKVSIEEEPKRELLVEDEEFQMDKRLNMLKVQQRRSCRIVWRLIFAGWRGGSLASGFRSASTLYIE